MNLPAKAAMERLLADSAEVIAMRLWQLPVWSVFEPQRVAPEMMRMVAEKHAAWWETQNNLAALPGQLWLDTVAELPIMNQQPTASLGNYLNRVSRSVSNAVMAPSMTRVRANKARLKRPH